ncbi:MAG: two-component system sensor histidine kinase CreC [Verrucomicrobiales bacterium]
MRLTLLIILGFFVIAGGTFFWMRQITLEDVGRQYSQAAEEPLVDTAHLLASLLEQDIVDGRIHPERFRNAFHDANRREFEARIYALVKNRIATSIYVLDANGLVVFDSEGLREGQDFSGYRDYRLTIKGGYGARASRTDPNDPRTTVFHVAAPVTWQGDIIGVLTVMRSETAMAPFAEETRDRLTWAAIRAAAVITVLGALWTYWLVSPIGSLTSYARSVRNGLRTVTRPAAGHAELRLLRDAVEEMRHELEGRQYVENYVQALTHELKSPLAAIRGASELLTEASMPEEKRERFLANIRAETERCDELIRGLLRLAALETRQDLDHREPVDLAALAREELALITPRCTGKSMRLSSHGLDEPAMVNGDSLVLGLALRNVLSNAVDFSPQGGTLTVTLRREFPSAGPRISLTVSDTGPGFPDYALTRAFERFFSLKHEATGRKGTGLGLCLAKEAVELHRGTVGIRNREEGGAAVTISLPSEAA